MLIRSMDNSDIIASNGPMVIQLTYVCGANKGDGTPCCIMQPNALWQEKYTNYADYVGSGSWFCYT